MSLTITFKESTHDLFEKKVPGDEGHSEDIMERFN